MTTNVEVSMSKLCCVNYTVLIKPLKRRALNTKVEYKSFKKSMNSNFVNT